MKLIATIFTSTFASTGFAKNYNGAIKRNLSGAWLDENFGKGQRYFPDTISSTKFEQIAKMVAFLEGKEPTEEYLQQIEDDQTSYGCYCWNKGVENVQELGGGQHMDKIDSVCSKLYRCYKCIDVDYNLDYKNNKGALAELGYTAIFIGDQVNERSINCEFNGKTSSENLCRCDVDFAESIAQLRSECNAGNQESCPDLKYYTPYSKFDGNFDYDASCRLRANQGQERDQCCGIYPNRRSYDKEVQECCQTDLFEVFKYKLVPKDTCQGKVVVSVQGNPNEYIPAQSENEILEILRVFTLRQLIQIKANVIVVELGKLARAPSTQKVYKRIVN
ncbi:Oidioi.mRNA.OKI2018_I69.PAR.g9203.t1.cds [Oikopleura dioica]|uniref:Oidioi.mRNA.OKI2018_I69.PAR.g9203.t1.cds n=1 Tax=Oikopleura dioica TaxID=34765 RepID=A0ABN7RNN2_OIKDI|nr:Oidioi.mRNA.OKI2018_I69.PAR.g9203.t1.cds [Oikopleura dioica]